MIHTVIFNKKKINNKTLDKFKKLFNKKNKLLGKKSGLGISDNIL